MKGKLIPTPIFTVIDEIEHGAPAGLAMFEEAMIDYRKGDFVNARAGFEAAASAGLDDDLTRLYIKRCHEYLESPPENWDGVYVMTKK